MLHRSIVIHRRFACTRVSSLLSEIATCKDIRIWGGADVEDFWPLGGADVEDFGGADVEWITFMSPSYN